MNSKEIEIVLKAMALCENAEVKKLLEEALLVSKELDLYKFCFGEKDSYHAHLRGVYYHGGYAVATNGAILVKLKTDYDNKFEGKVIGRKGQVLGTSYVNYEYALRIDTYHEVFIDWEKVAKAPFYCIIDSQYYDSDKLKDIGIFCKKYHFDEIYSTDDRIFSKKEDGSAFMLMSMDESKIITDGSVDCNKKI